MKRKTKNILLVSLSLVFAVTCLGLVSKINNSDPIIPPVDSSDVITSEEPTIEPSEEVSSEIVSSEESSTIIPSDLVELNIADLSNRYVFNGAVESVEDNGFSKIPINSVGAYLDSYYNTRLSGTFCSGADWIAFSSRTTIDSTDFASQYKENSGYTIRYRFDNGGRIDFLKNGSYIKQNVADLSDFVCGKDIEHSFVFETYSDSSGVTGITLYVEGNLIYQYVDYDDPITTPGGFFFRSTSGGLTYIKE